MDSVSMDNRCAGFLATRHLIELGHRRIGYISGATPTVSRRERLAGYRQALGKAGLEAASDLVWGGHDALGYGDTNAAELGRAAGHDLLRLPDPPTALVALNDMHAVGACAAVRDEGGSIPGDVSVVGIDDIALASLLYPPLTTVHQPIDKLSEAAVDLLVSRLNGEASGEPSTSCCSRISSSALRRQRQGARINREFEGKVVLVTGGASGIGRGVVEAFAAEGAKVAFSYFTSEADAQAIAARTSSVAIKSDLTKPDAAKTLVAEVKKRLGPVEVLVVNTGGLIQRASVLECTLELWNEALNLNLTSAFLSCQAVLPDMLAAKRGVIITISSLAAHNGGGIRAAHYGAAKGGLYTFTKALAREVGPKGSV